MRHLSLTAIRLSLLCVALILVTAVGVIPAEAQYVNRSQEGSVRQKINTTEITIRYGRPVARGRTLFGDDGIVVHSPWTPGADSATTIEFSKDVWIDGQALPAGRYSIWFTPDTDPWGVIFSAADAVWHIPYPDREVVLELARTPFALEHLEVLTFSFPEVAADQGVIRFQWGTTALDIPVRVEMALRERP